MKRLSISGYGSFKQMADMLTEMSGHYIPRQRVYMWWKRRTQNFPDRHQLKINGQDMRLFKEDEVREWFETYKPYQFGRGRPPKHFSREEG